MDEWGWITRAGVAVALVLSVGNTAKLIWDARRQRREDIRQSQAEMDATEAERQLAELLVDLRDRGSYRYGGYPVVSGYLPGVRLGESRGMIESWWDDGQLRIRYKKDRAPI